MGHYIGRLRFPAARPITRTTSALVIVIGGLVLVGWVLNVPLLKSILPGRVSMKPNTAVALVLAGLAVQFALRPLAARRRPRLVLLLAGIVATIGGLTLLEYAGGWDLGLDQLLFPAAVRLVDPPYPGRMAPATALAFLLTGGALLGLAIPRAVRLGQGAALVVGLLGLLNFIGYAYSAQSFSGFVGTTQVALHTAVALLLLSLGLLYLVPDRGLMAVVTSDSISGTLARRLLPAALVVPFLLGWLGLGGQRAGFYGLEFGIALFALATALIFTGLIWWTVRSLYRHDTARRQAETALRASAEHFRFLFAHNPLPMWVYDRETLQFLEVNEAAVGYYGYTQAEFLQMRIVDIRPPEEIPRLLADLAQERPPLQQAGEWRHRRQNGEVIDVQITSHTITYDQRPGCLVAIQDITVRKRAETALRENEMRLFQFLEAVPLGLSVFDAAQRLYYVNRVGQDLLGQDTGADPAIAEVATAYQAYQAGTGQVYPPAALPIVRAFAGETTTVEDMEIHRPDRVIPLQVWGAPIYDDAGHIIYGIIAYTDITERKQAEAGRLAQAAAEAANQAKNEFLSRMSHELRTPLNAILGFSQLLELATLPPQEAESVTYILKAGRHLLALINEVLDLTRIEAGRLALSPEPVLLEEVVQDSLALVQPSATAHQIQLLPPDLRGAPPYVLADQQRLKQVLLNLLSNAIKYNRPAGQVAVTWAVLPDGVLRLSVQDTGPGIAPEYLPRLFTPFDRLGAEASEVEGTGLGLALSRRLMEAMAGVLGVDSTVGAGSTFWIDLPVVAGPPAAPEPPAAPSPVPPSQRTRTLLLIDDNVANLRLVERILETRPGVQILAALQGGLGLELAREHQPDLVVLDLQLPDLSGVEVLRRLQADPTTAAIPVIILSADATPGQIDRLRAAGAYDYLTKPFRVPAFLALIDAVLPPHDGR